MKRGLIMLRIRGKEINAKTLAKMIDISYVHPEGKLDDIRGLVDTCIKYDVNACCVNPNYLEYIVAELKGTDVKPDVVIDYPFGTATTPVKCAQIEEMLKKGAVLIDPVIEFGAIINGDAKKVTQEVKDCVAACQGHETRFIIEVTYLTPEEVVMACNCVAEGGGDYVKSSTGRVGGPDMKIIKLMADTLKGSNTGIKLAGTGRFWTTAVALGCVAAGVDLIGTRAGDQIINELPLFEGIFKNIEIF